VRDPRGGESGRKEGKASYAGGGDLPAPLGAKKVMHVVYPELYTFFRKR